MEELGKELKQRRIELGYSIEEISNKTSLSVKNIRQLETGDIASFKEDLTYIPFYFKNYCKILNIDYNELRSRLDDSIESYTTALKLEEMNQKKEIEKNIRKTITTSPKKKVRLNYGFISFLVVIIVLLIALIYGITIMLNQSKKTVQPAQVVTTQSQPTQVVAPVKEEVKVEAKKAEVTALSSTIYQVKISKESTFKVHLDTDSWMSFAGSSNPLAEKVYTKNENPTISVKPNDKVMVRMGVVGTNYFEVDDTKINFKTDLNLTVPNTFEIRFIGE